MTEEVPQSFSSGNSIDSRIQVLDFPNAAPGKCVVCGFAGGIESDDRKFIDWGFSLDFYGAIIICSKCIQSIANSLDYASPEQIEKLHIFVNEMLEERRNLREENYKLRNALSNLHFLPSDDSPIENGADPEGQDDSGSDESGPSGGSEIVSDSESDAESEPEEGESKPLLKL